MFKIGLDIGSTTAKIVVLDETEKLVYTSVIEQEKVINLIKVALGKYDL